MIVPLPQIDPEHSAFGRRLHDVRAVRGFTVEALAQAAHLSAAKLRLAEQGRVRLDSSELHALINCLHIPLALLFTSGIDVSSLRRLV